MPRSLFAPHLAEIVALAKRHAFHTKNVIGGRRVKIEIRKRKGEQEMFSREGKGEVFETEEHLSIFVSIDFFRRDLPQRFLGIGNHLLQGLVSNPRNLGLGMVGNRKRRVGKECVSTCRARGSQYNKKKN